jgi:hypothetical protein
MLGQLFWTWGTASEASSVCMGNIFHALLNTERNKWVLSYFGILTQRVIVVLYRRFGTTYRSHLRVSSSTKFLDCLPPEDGTDKLSRNVNTEIPFCAEFNPKIGQIPLTLRWKPNITQHCKWFDAALCVDKINEGCLNLRQLVLLDYGSRWKAWTLRNSPVQSHGQDKPQSNSEWSNNNHKGKADAAFLPARTRLPPRQLQLSCSESGDKIINALEFSSK